MRELIIKWLHEALAMKTGEELYIPVDNKDYQKDLYKMFRKELDALRSIDPEGASKLRVGTSYKDAKFWVMIKKINLTPLVAFKKSDAGVTRVRIENTRRSHGSLQ